jgi:hypothetical protein
MRYGLLVSVALAVVVFALSGGAGAASTVPLTVGIKGAGTVKVSGKPPVSCKATCRVTLQVPVGTKIAVAFIPVKLWKLAPVVGACKGVAPKCAFKTTRAAVLNVTFLAPGLRTNPIPLKTPWRLPGNWTMKVDSADFSPSVMNVGGGPQTPPAGAQYVMPYVEWTYTGGGSSLSLSLFGVQLNAEGSHNAAYSLQESQCGPGEARLPEPDLQVKVENGVQVYSGQSVAGNICFQVAANDAASLLLDYHTYSGKPADTWFALR